MTAQIAKKHYENGVKLIKSGKYAEAEAAIAEAIALDEQQAEYWAKLGLVWSKQEKYAAACEASQMAVALQPENPDFLYNLGVAYIQLGETDKGIGFIEKSFSLKPNKSLAISLGDTLFTQRNFKLASYYYMKARQIDPNDAELQSKLATALYNDNDTIPAIVLFTELVIKYPTNRANISALVEIYRKFNLVTFDQKAYQALLICLKTDNVKHRNLGSAWSSLIMLDPKLASLRELANAPVINNLVSIKEALADEFLQLGLTMLPVLDTKLEIMLSDIRKTFLLNHHLSESWPKEALQFLSALAVQCWYNDFVFFETPEEEEALASIEKILKGGTAHATLYALYSCYRPLYSLNLEGNKLPLDKSALYDMRALVKAQLTNPARERELIDTIPDFTEITDDVSRAVQEMYAKRPYPRWKSGAKGAQSQEVADLTRGLTTLVAGCGTGQEPSMLANAMPLTRTTAIDLSLPSIAYGKRMAEELGFANRIDFLHGDLMEVGKLEKKFDFVVSSGVLHHMKEPEKGWRAILQTLKPHGRMSISLYSKIARDYAFGPANIYIQEKGYSSSDNDIRAFRRDVMALPQDNPIKRCMRATDFYMLSECNDLLFHVQEHRMTCLDLKEMSDRLGLELIQVYLSPTAQKKWQERFPGVTSYDFDNLHLFEQENPDTFIEMYKMYFRRKDEISESPLDPLIQAYAI